MRATTGLLLQKAHPQQGGKHSVSLNNKNILQSPTTQEV